MGKQYKHLSEKDIEFINLQKVFYIASSSTKEVNLSPKGYDTIRVLNNKTLVFLDYPGSGNRTYNDAINDGEFTILFNSYDEKAIILRMFCKANIVEHKSDEFYTYLEMFGEKEALVRNFFVFELYGVESSCGDGVPYMEFKGERDSLKKWVIKMDGSGKLQEYIKSHAIPPDMKNF